MLIVGFFERNSLNSLNSIFYILSFILLGLTVLDISLNRILALHGSSYSNSDFKTYLFYLESTFLILCQISLLILIKTKIKDNFVINRLKKNFALFLFVQTLAFGLIIFTLFEISFYSYYSTITSSIIFNISYLLSLYFLYLLTRLFFKWYSINNNLLFLLFAISTGTLFFNTLLGISLIDLGIASMPELVYPHYSMGYVPFFFNEGVLVFMNNLIIITTITSFCSCWISAVSLLYAYFTKVGKIKFWAITLIPLLYFLIPFIPDIIYLIPTNLLNYYFVFISFNKTIGGILFGLSFFIMAKRFDKDDALKKYLNLFGIGLTVVFVANQSLVMLNLPYPPFGLVGISMISFGSLLLMYGISYSSAHLNLNIQMRKYIEKITADELGSYKFLNEIGRTEVVNNLENRVNQISRKYLSEMNESYNVTSSFIKEDSISAYINEVVTELSIRKNGSEDGE